MALKRLLLASAMLVGKGFPFVDPLPAGSSLEELPDRGPPVDEPVTRDMVKAAAMAFAAHLNSITGGLLSDGG